MEKKVNLITEIVKNANDYVSILLKTIISEEIPPMCVDIVSDNINVYSDIYETLESNLEDQKKDLPFISYYQVNQLEKELICFGILVNQYLRLAETEKNEIVPMELLLNSNMINLVEIYDKYMGMHILEKLQESKIEKAKNIVSDYQKLISMIDIKIAEYLKAKNGSDLDRILRTIELQTTPETLLSQQKNLEDMIKQSQNYEMESLLSDDQFNYDSENKSARK